MRSSTWVLLVSVLAAAPVRGTEPALRFVDATADSGIDFAMTSGDSPSSYILEVNGGGVALFDFDRDGDLDLFLANGATIARPEQGPGSRLYANAGDGTFEDVTASRGIAIRRWAMGVAVGDYDGDGDEDLYVTCFGPNILLRNDVAQSGRFTDVTREAGVGDPRWATSAAFGDVDGDGDVDLYVANYLEFDTAKPPDRTGRMFLGIPVMAGPSGLPAQPDVLYENRGDGTFRDITRKSGCAGVRPGYGLGVAMVDFDLDGKPDIFVGNDSTENFLFRNLGGLRFENVGVVSGIAANYDGGTQATMGIAVADVDGNGLPDVFTTNFSSDTNTLHLNLDGTWFDDRTSQYGLAMVSRPFLSWGTGFYDFDSDGDEDLFIASGHVYPQAARHEMDSEYEQPVLLFERKGERFVRHVGSGAPFAQRFRGRSCAFGDLDGDGDVDVAMTTLNGKVRVFRNEAPRQARVVVALKTRRGSLCSPAARVELRRGSTLRRRWIGGGSYQSVDAPEAYFGLGRVTGDAATSIRVVWPDGKSQEHSGVPLNRKVTVTRDRKKIDSAPLR